MLGWLTFPKPLRRARIRRASALSARTVPKLGLVSMSMLHFWHVDMFPDERAHSPADETVLVMLSRGL